VHNYVLNEHYYSYFVIYNVQCELKIWKNYSVVKIIIFTDFNFTNFYILLYIIKKCDLSSMINIL
jgi:hypothetical protein